MVVVSFPSERIPKREVIPTEEGLIFKDPKNEALYKWENIVHMFSRGSSYVLSITDNKGRTATGALNIRGTRHRSYRVLVNNFWQLWLDHIPNRRDILKFRSPEWYVKLLKKAASKDSKYGLALAALFLVLIIGYALDGTDFDKEKYIRIFGGLLFIIIGLWYFISYRKRSHKAYYTEIAVEDHNHIKVTYDDNSSVVLRLSDIRRHNLNKLRTNAKIHFRDGTKLNHVERVSFWPVLREYLLSSLEPQGHRQ